jgi:aryl-alcohol dehydrogenase-like predicted oxidoreductase
LIERIPFGSTGHASSRILFGAAALGGMRQDRADRLLEPLFEHGVNHLDTAASYGDSELRLAPWLARHRAEFFLATKTGSRSAAGARESLHRSLDRLGVDSVDLIQLHNLVDEDGWQKALAPGGAVEALVEAREQGLTRFIGVTGHGTRAPAMHLQSLERFPFDSVLLPCNHTMLQQPDYAADFARLISLCAERGVAVQTIKSLARRRWTEDAKGPRFSWYEPIRDAQAIDRAVAFVLSRPGHFLNTSSDATLLLPTLEAAARGAQRTPDPAELAADVRNLDIQPLFVPGIYDEVGPA